MCRVGGDPVLLAICAVWAELCEVQAGTPSSSADQDIYQAAGPRCSGCPLPAPSLAGHPRGAAPFPSLAP